jgi:hypothetical protein
MKAQRVNNILALKSKEGEWVRDPAAKADLLAATFAGKNIMPPAQPNEFSKVLNKGTRMVHADVPTLGAAKYILEHLKDSSATGPDLLPSRILRECAAQLAVPLLYLACRILKTGRWPEMWIEHWIVPLYKKKAVYDPTNYRGVHLTAQISKAMERLIGTLWLPQLAAEPKFFGLNQFAYLPGKGARDALAVMVLTWLDGMCRKMKFGLYCSDVSGAFDKVDAARLVHKLRIKGFSEDIINVLQSWLRKRHAKVVVSGKSSRVMTLENQVFQGTVWGPSLWNTFFEDAQDAVAMHDFTSTVFADDLNSFKEFPLATKNSSILDEINKTQTSLHAWGKANSVSFDPGKESKHVISTYDPHGADFTILGVSFDCKLTMDRAVHDVSVSCGWKLQALLRSNRFFNSRELVNLYKSHVLSFIEYRTSALYHASDKVLKSLDSIQNRMLRIVDATELDALMYFNLAPLSTRRDIAMLGMIHRAVIGKGPDQLRRFFYRNTQVNTCYIQTRRQESKHSAELKEYRDGSHKEYISRSALGLVSVYNLLPENMLDIQDISVFQGALQDLVKGSASRGDGFWQKLLSPRWDLTCHPLAKR